MPGQPGVLCLVSRNFSFGGQKLFLPYETYSFVTIYASHYTEEGSYKERDSH